VDILAHSLWAGVGAAAVKRRWPKAFSVPHWVAASAALAALPDVVHLLPIVVWAIFGTGHASDLWSYAIATPQSEPTLPEIVYLWSHHLHCVMHSAIVAAVASVLVFLFSRAFWAITLGWWSHIVIDVFTHSADFYPAPIFYPFSQRGFDGLAWNTPWLFVLNYIALTLALAWLWLRRSRTRH
jgi:LexA-binding, inner membrane-associated putative hydrolase